MALLHHDPALQGRVEDVQGVNLLHHLEGEAGVVQGLVMVHHYDHQLQGGVEEGPGVNLLIYHHLREDKGERAYEAR